MLKQLKTQWLYGSRLLKKMSFTKLYHLFLAHYSFYFNKQTRLKHLPTSFSIEPTTACNLGCPECPSGLKSFTRPTGNMTFDLFKTSIDDIKNHALYLNIYFQGEPMIHPKLMDFIKYSEKSKIFTSISTNAHFISEKSADQMVESQLSRVVISLDGMTQESYEQYRVHGDIHKVFTGIDYLIKAKKKAKTKFPIIQIQYLVVAPNEHEIPLAEAYVRKNDIDELVFKTAQIYDYKNGSPLIPKNDKYSRYKKNKDGSYSIKNNLEDQCWRLWKSTVITWDGNVIPCCFDKDAKYKMGNISKNKIKNIWNSKDYQSFRNQLLTSRKSIDICQNCSEGTKIFES